MSGAPRSPVPVCPAGTAALEDRCPRCGQAFHCGVQDAAPCACSRLRLTAEQLAGLRERYSTCLCVTCLEEVAAGGGLG